MIRLATLLGFALIVFVIGCSSSEPASLQNPDNYAKWGCEHFVNVFKDHRDGVLTQVEKITKYNEVYNELNDSEVPGLGDRAGELRHQIAQNPSMGAGNSWSYRLLEDCTEVLQNS